MARVLTARAAAAGAACTTALAVLAFGLALAPAARGESLVPQLDLNANFTINGADSTNCCMTLERVGDMNGDGRDDIAVGRTSDQTNKGVVYVIFSPAPGAAGGDPTKGRTDTLTSLTNPGGANEGFRIVGGATADGIANDLAGGGDINGDGRPDLVVAAGGILKAFVIFGKTDDATVNLGALGSGGYVTNNGGTADGGGSQIEVAIVPDQNADGRDEVLAGDPNGDRLPGGTSTENSGSTFLLFGKATSAATDINALGTAGYELRGAAGMKSGREPTAVPDMNGDGKAELLIGAPDFDSDTGTTGLEGAVFVVFGGSVAPGGVFDLSSLNGDAGDPGFRVTGPIRRAASIVNQARLGNENAAGDINGDGRGDLVLSASTWNRTAAASVGTHGAVFVVYGRSGTATVSTDQGGS